MPKYSLSIPTFNRSKITASVVYNFLNLLKDRSDYELIVVDDGSTDDTVDIIMDIMKRNRQIRLLRTSKTDGEYRNPGFSRNTGIQFSKGRIICFCDGDIIHLSNPLDSMDQVLLHKDPDAIYTTGVYFRCESNGKVIGPNGLNKNMPHGSWLSVSRNNLIRMGGYDERYKTYGNEDHDIVQRLDRMGLEHISREDIIGMHPLFDSGRDTSDHTDLLRQKQMEYQRESSVIRNIDKEWGSGEEVTNDHEVTEPDIIDETVPAKDISKVELEGIYKNTKDIKTFLEMLSADSIKTSKILNLCINLNSSLVGSQQGIFTGKIHKHYNNNKEVFKFVQNSNLKVYSDLPSFQLSDETLACFNNEVDLAVLSQVHRQRNVGDYLDSAFNALRVGGELVVVCPFYSNCIGSGNTNNLWNAGALLYNLILAGFDCKNAKVSTFTNEIQVYLVKSSRVVPRSVSISSLNDFFPIEVYQHFNGNILEINWNE